MGRKGVVDVQGGPLGVGPAVDFKLSAKNLLFPPPPPQTKQKKHVNIQKLRRETLVFIVD